MEKYIEPEVWSINYFLFKYLSTVTFFFTSVGDDVAPHETGRVFPVDIPHRLLEIRERVFELFAAFEHEDCRVRAGEEAVHEVLQPDVLGEHAPVVAELCAAIQEVTQVLFQPLGDCTTRGLPAAIAARLARRRRG